MTPTAPAKTRTGPLPHTDEIADEKWTKPPDEAMCPKCKVVRPIFRDKQLRRYFQRHLMYARSTWCEMSGKEVKK